MKKTSLLVVSVAFSVILWAVPAMNVRAVGHNSVLAAQQDEPKEPAAQEPEAQTFVGQIMNHDGKYALHDEDGKTYQLNNQDKAKDFDGKKVTITGPLDEEGMMIHVSEIEEAEA